MHGQLLLQVPDLLLEALDLQSWVHHRIDSCLVRDFHHARGKFERRCRFRQMPRLRPDVCNHDSLTVTANGIAKEICQFRLAIWNVSPLLA